jgi:ankyrin repeat protein
MLFALRNGIDINRVNALGHTALHVAIEGEDLDAIRLLLGAGADVEMKS